MGVTNQHFLPALILTGPGRRHPGVPLSLLQLGNRYGTSNGITRVDWPKELKHQLTCNVIQIAAHLGRQGRREQALNHQTALFIWNHVMYPLITREPTEEPDIFFSERPFPGKNVSNVYHLCSFLCTLTCRSLSLRQHWPFRLPGQNDVFCPAHQGAITGKVIERADALGTDRRVVVGAQETSYGFTKFQDTAEVSLCDRRAVCQQVIRHEPAPELLRVCQFRVSA